MGEHVDGRRLRYADRRDELLRAATEHVLDHGLSGLSLRKVADTVGVSHATLVHHFSTKEQLVSEIVDLVLTRTFTAPDLVAREEHPLRALWKRAVDEKGRRYIRLFVAITGHAMHGDATIAAAVERSMSQRIALLAGGLIRSGCPPEQADALATLVLATMRGLVVDLLVTGDEQRVADAFEALMADLDARRATWSS